MINRAKPTSPGSHAGISRREKVRMATEASGAVFPPCKNRKVHYDYGKAI
jgi:hypothetical protein